MDEFDKKMIAMGAVSPERFQNADATPIPVPADKKKEYWQRMSLLILNDKANLAKAMNDSGIAISANAPNSEFTTKIAAAFAGSNMVFVENVAAVLRDYHKRHPIKDSIYAS